MLALCLWLPVAAQSTDEPSGGTPTGTPPAESEESQAGGEPLPVPAEVRPTADAGPTGDAARSGLAETLDREIARADVHLEALATLSAAVEAERARELESIREAETATAERAAELSQRAEDDRSATRIYEALLGLLEREQPRLADAMERTELVPGLAPFAPRLDTRGLDTPAFHAQLAELDQRLQQIREAETEIRRRQEDGCWQLLDARARLMSRLYQAREGAIEALPRERRRALLGISREGFDALTLEIERLRIGVEAWVHRTLRTLREIPALLDDLFAVGRLTWIALKLLVVLTLLLALRQRRQALREKLLEWADTFGATRRGRRRLRSLAELTATLMPSLLVLLLVLAVRWALGGLASRPEIDLPLRLLFLYGIYALATALTYALALWLTRRYHMSVAPSRRREILRTIRTVMRVSFALAALLLLSAEVLGRGVLFHKVVQAAWVIGIIAFFFLIARWRPVIAEAYLGAGRDGRLARLVERTRNRWYGFFVVAAAFGWLAVHGLGVVLRDFALSFDQTRKALAFIFRRRMEKQAEVSGYADVAIDALPATLVDAAAEAPAQSAELLVDRFPGREKLSEMLARWREDDTRGSFLLSGPKGIGKTTWLNRIDGGDLPVIHIPIRSRIHTEHALRNLLAPHLAPDDECKDLASLSKALRDGPPRIAVVDVMQNLFVSRVGGYKVIEAFISLIESTSDKVFWICGISAFACEHLFAVHPELMIFRHHEVLRPWTEEEIGALIQRRAEASGVQVEYDALLAERAERDAFDERVVEAAEGYSRLIWDYSSGLPRVALHFWLRSLVPVDDNRVRIKLFRQPSENELLQLGQRALFLLAAIVVHENLSLAEAAKVTRYPEAVCRIQLEQMRDRKMLTRIDRRYRLSTYWHRAVIRVLTRNNLLPD
ncbi:hypothetical protein ABI59_01840 [Acidobacteria bacterium Mor1]|nr:hypothetical protein ABI59_01840 [Acidobacteria bacterium Mor1]